MAQQTALGRLRRLQRHDHRRSRHLDVLGRNAEPSRPKGRCRIAPLLPGRIDRERNRVPGSGDPSQTVEHRGSHCRSLGEQDRAPWSVVDPIPAQRPGPAPNGSSLLDGHRRGRHAIELDQVAQRRPAQATL